MERRCQLPSLPAGVRIVLEGRGSPAQLRSAVPGTGSRGAQGGLSSFHGSNRKTRDCSTWKNSTHTCTHAPRHTPHTPGTKANMFRPSAGRDTRQRRAVQISRGSLVLVDSPRKKQPPEVVVAQLCKIWGYLVFGNCKRGIRAVCDGRGGWKYSAVFPGVLLALQPVRAWGEGEGGGFLRGPRIHPMLHQQRGREGPPWLRQSSWLHKNAAPDNSRLQLYHSHGDNVPSSRTGEAERSRRTQLHTPGNGEGLAPAPFLSSFSYKS